MMSHPLICCRPPFKMHHPHRIYKKIPRSGLMSGPCLLKGLKGNGRAALLQPLDGTSKTQETEESAQLSELQVAVLAAEWSTCTVQTFPCSIGWGHSMDPILER